MPESHDDLTNGVVLAELGGHGDGPYCAKHAAGAALVLLGTYIVDSGDAVPYPSAFVFKPGRENYAAYLREHVVAARDGGGKVGVSVISIRLDDSVDFLAAAEDAGADYASLCVHSPMEMFVTKGLGSALCYPENREALKEWAAALVGAVNIPVIVKMGLADLDDLAHTSAAIDVMAGAGVPIVNINIGKSDAGSEGLRVLPQLSKRCDFLIAGGGVSDAEGARRAIEAGAGAVAIGRAAMKDPSLCGRIQGALRPD